MSQLQPLATPMYDAPLLDRAISLATFSLMYEKSLALHSPSPCFTEWWLNLWDTKGIYRLINSIQQYSLSWFIIHQLSLTGGFMDPFICIIRSFHRFFSYVRRIPPPKKKHQDFMVHVSIAAHLPWPTKVTFVHRLRGAPEASKAPTPAETPSGAGAEPRETQRLLALEVRNLGREIRWITTWDVSQTFQNNGISMDFNYQPQLAISSINSWSWQSGMCFTLC